MVRSTPLIDFVYHDVEIEQTLTLRIDADDGPLFGPSINEIWMSSEFLVEIENRFEQARFVDTQKSATMWCSMCFCTRCFDEYAQTSNNWLNVMEH